MTGFNHAAVGGFIGKFLPLPLAIPAAFISHFVLDSLPHYGLPQDQRDRRRWRWFFILDFIAAWTFLGGIALYRQHYQVLFCGLVAASPDLAWVIRVVRNRTFNLSDHKTKYDKWHAGIQRFERPWGIYIEVPLALVLGYFVITTW